MRRKGSYTYRRFTRYTILLDPYVDNEYKFSADYLPNRPGAIEFSDSDWYIAYAIRNGGDVYIARMRHKSSLLDLD